MVRQAREQGIKFSVPARFRLPDLPGAPLTPRTFTCTYFDTADLQLAHGGILLRRRVEDRIGRWQLKLGQGKSCLERNSRGGPTGPPLDLRDLLFVHLREDVLRPAATLRTRRTGVQVRTIEGPVAMVTLDRVTVLDEGRATRRWTEVEVEQTGDAPGALERVAAALRAAGAGPHDQRPKLFQALAITPRPTGRPAPHDPAAIQLAQHIQRQVALLLAHDPGARAGTDPEPLHQMRVATRRLRAYLRSARPVLQHEWADTLREELGWLGRTLGPARDLDVMAERLAADFEGLEQQDRRPFTRLLRGLGREREDARKSVLTLLRSDRYLKLIDRLRHAAATPRVAEPTGSLPRCAAGEFKRLRKAMRGRGPDISDHALHRLRIKVKRARYAAELAEPAGGKRAGRFIAQAKALQDQLGEHQDAVAAEHYLRRLLAGKRGTALALIAGMIIERMRRRRRKARATLDRLWKKLDKQGQHAWGAFTRPGRTSHVARPPVVDAEAKAGFLESVPEGGS